MVRMNRGSAFFQRKGRLMKQKLLRSLISLVLVAGLMSGLVFAALPAVTCKYFRRKRA